MQKLLLLLLPAFSFAQSKVNYTVFYNEKMAVNGMQIAVSFALPKAADSTYLQYSDEVWGEKNISKCIKTLHSKHQDYRFKIMADSNRIIIYHQRTKKIDFDYTIKQDYEGDSTNIFSRPRIKNEYFHVLGQSLFIVPEFIATSPKPALVANIVWNGFPEKYAIHNMFGSNERVQVLKLRLWEDLYNSLFVGGDYRIHRFYNQKQPIYFAVRGTWKTYSDSALLSGLEKSIGTQRTFWNDHNFPYYTVVMSPTLTQNDSLFRGQSITGSGIRNGFMIQSSNNPFNTWQPMKYVFNHELMHDWIGGKIPMRNEELNYWFSEGFTDYYTYKNRLRSGDIDFETWLKTFNREVISAHFKNPEKNKPNYTIKDNFWKDRNFEKLPYRRGAIFAFWLDNQIQKQSKGEKSLDDLMRDLLGICVKQNKKFTDELFLDTANKYLKTDITYFFQKYVLSGTDFDFKTEDLMEGFEIEYKNETMVLKAKKEVKSIYLGRK
jgi:predicted metalloprotease with PDZ domain